MKNMRTENFYYEIPEDGQTQVNLQLMSCLKARDGEKWDSSDPANGTEKS